MPARQRGSARKAKQKKEWAKAKDMWWMTEGEEVPSAAPPVTPMATTAQAAPPVTARPPQAAQTLAPPRTVAAPPVATTPMAPYLPTTLRTRAQPAQPGAGQPTYFDPYGQPPAATLLGRGGWGLMYDQELMARMRETEAARGYTGPLQEEPTITAAAAGGGGSGGTRDGGTPAPAGVDPGWYQRFQQEHDGQTPEQFYAQTGEGLPHALADREWSEGFAQMYGRPPNEYDWRAHWFSTRIGYSPEDREKWERQRGRAIAKQRDEERERPPTYMPPQIIWR